MIKKKILSLLFIFLILQSLSFIFHNHNQKAHDKLIYSKLIIKKSFNKGINKNFPIPSKKTNSRSFFFKYCSICLLNGHFLSLFKLAFGIFILKPSNYLSFNTTSLSSLNLQIPKISRSPPSSF